MNLGGNVIKKGLEPLGYNPDRTQCTGIIAGIYAIRNSYFAMGNS